MSGEFTVSCIQITAVDGEKQATVDKVLELVRKAGERGSKLVVLPEVWTGLGYSSKEIYRTIAEPIPGPTTELLMREAKRHGMYIAGSLYEDAGRGVYHNSCPLIGPDGRILGIYRKTHLFDAPNRPDIQSGIRESDKVRAGDDLPVLGIYRKTHLFDAPNRPDIQSGIRESDKVRAGDDLPVFDTAIGRVGLSVCSDLRFPEVYREMTLKGARLLICASAFLSPRLDHWEFFLRARAAENQVWVVASGQYGTEPKSGIGFVGRSMIVDPWGTITATASDEETCLSAVIDPAFVDEVRGRYPLLEQRRPELYGSIGTMQTAHATAAE
jgi:predicted amidohydrolase